jgi:hypothetical protein
MAEKHFEDPVNTRSEQLDKHVNRPKMRKENVEKRIEAIHDAVKRARSALLLCILASGAMFLCLWNTYASWDRDFAFLDDKDYVGVDGKLSLSDQTKKAWENHVNALPQHLHEHQLHSWVDTQVVSVALLGIKISVSDFAIIGSVALAICSFYLLLCVRRENHEVGYLFREMSEEDLKTYGPHALAMVSSFMVFNLSDEGTLDGVIESLKAKPVERKISLIRKASRLLDFFPAITITATIVCDVGWTFWKTNYGHELFLSPFRPLAGNTAFHEFSPGEIVYFCFAEAFALTAVIVLWRMSRLVKAYDKGIRELLDEVSEWLIKERLIERRWPKQQAENKGKIAANVTTSSAG